MVQTRSIRIAVQAAVFALWATLLVLTRHPIEGALAEAVPVSILLRLDPLVMTVVNGGLRLTVTLTLLGFVTLAVSLLLGRVFCGWVCPLGAIFDAWGWVLRKLRLPIEGPSPHWFRAKYYLLAAILAFAALGGFSPLIGLDPIVLLTRTAAVALNPAFREGALWLPRGFPTELAFRGGLIDAATLLLFVTIMAGTTRLSRIWCRTACPLGAYLAVASRHSVLRRETKDCVRCNICTTRCPTGAIDFKNPEVYSESECIKCFSCSAECPVDANQFVITNPLPAFSPSNRPVSIERRKLIGAVGAAVVAQPLLELAAGDVGASKRLLRPPMSREEREFLSACIRCGECMKACPTGTLKPAGLEHGIRAFWTPVMTPAEAPCEPGCNACSIACPTTAIQKYPLEEKFRFKSGTAVFDSSRCIAHTEDKFCNECVRACPTDAIAIAEGWIPSSGDSRGSEERAPAGEKPRRPIGVSFDRCIGCGACETSCSTIVFGASAMVTTSAGRAVPATLPGRYFEPRR